MAKPVYHFDSSLVPHLRLQAFGDCNTEGSEKLPVGECVPSKIKQQLEQIGINVSLENHGGTMNCSREGVARSRDCLSAADVVLINYGLVDSWVTSLPQLYVPYYPQGRLRKFARKLLKLVKRRLRSPAIRKILPVGPVVELDEFAQNIEAIINDVRSRNSSVQILLWSTVPVQDNETRNRLISEYNQCLESMSKEHSCKFFAIEPVLEDRDELYLDNVHLNGEGANEVAGKIVDALGADIEGMLNFKRAA